MDLRLGIRDLDEAWLVSNDFLSLTIMFTKSFQNNGEVPDFMNLIPWPPAEDPDQVSFSSIIRVG
jgi:hypothetical protein